MKAYVYSFCHSNCSAVGKGYSGSGAFVHENKANVIIVKILYFMIQNYKLFYIFAMLKHKIYFEKGLYPHHSIAFDDSGIVAT